MIIIKKKPVYKNGHRFESNTYDRFFRGKWDNDNPIMDYCIQVNKYEIIELYNKNMLAGEVKEYIENKLLKKRGKIKNENSNTMDI